MRTLYSWLIRAAAPAAFAQVLLRGLRDPGYRQGLTERFGFGPSPRSASIWLHAVSLGEMSAAAPLVKALRSRYPQLALVITTATLSTTGFFTSNVTVNARTASTAL